MHPFLYLSLSLSVRANAYVTFSISLSISLFNLYDSLSLSLFDTLLSISLTDFDAQELVLAHARPDGDIDEDERLSETQSTVISGTAVCLQYPVIDV